MLHLALRDCDGLAGYVIPLYNTLAVQKPPTRSPEPVHAPGPLDATQIRAHLCGPADKCTRWLMLAGPRCFASLSFLLTTNLSDPQFGDVLGALQALTRTVGCLALPTPRNAVHPHSPPHSQDFRRHSSGRCVISRNSWAAANLRGCVIFFARVLTRFPHFLPPPQPIPPPFPLFSSPQSLLIGLQVGVGRSDGVSAGEFCPIFYRR